MNSNDMLFWVGGLYDLYTGEQVTNIGRTFVIDGSSKMASYFDKLQEVIEGEGYSYVKFDTYEPEPLVCVDGLEYKVTCSLLKDEGDGKEFRKHV